MLGRASAGADFLLSPTGFRGAGFPPDLGGGSDSFSANSVNVDTNGVSRVSVWMSLTASLTAIRSPTLQFHGVRNRMVRCPFQSWACSTRLDGTHVSLPGESEREK